MENTRESILKMFFKSIKDMLFINLDEEDYNTIPTMSDLKPKDWELLSDAERKEILQKSPERIKSIVSEFLNKVLPRKTKTSFASGASVSKKQNIKNQSIIINEQTEISDDFEIGG